MGGRGRAAALAVQAVSGQASWLGIRLMMSYLALAQGADALHLGLQSSAFALAGLTLSLPAGRLSDRFGGAVVASAGLLASLVGVGLILLVPTLQVGLVAAAVMGAGHISTLVGQQSFIAQSAPAGRSDAAFGSLTAAASIGQLIGPLVVVNAATVGASDAQAPDTAVGLAVCAGMIAVALPPSILLSRTRTTRSALSTSDTARTPVREVLATPGMLGSFTVSGAVTVTVDLVTTFIPVWAVSQGVSPTAVGWLLALRAAVSVASRLGMTRLVARFGRKPLIVATVTIAATAVAALPLAGQWTAVPVMVLLGIGIGLPQPLTMAWVTSLVPTGVGGTALGTRMTGNRLAQTIIPLAVGAAAGPTGVTAVFLSTAALLAGAAVVAATADIVSPTSSPDPPTD